MANSTVLKPQVILGIETSCDETAAAVGTKTGNRVKILSNIVASSQDLQAKYGGVIPEQAAREQLKSIIPVITEALHKSNKSPEEIDAIAVTAGPGLIGSLLVGVETAKTLSVLWNKPLIAVNHLIAHFYAHWATDNEPPIFPALGLLVSGGHTDLILIKDHGVYEYLGGTRDDAAGECFDKCARILSLPYPGGPHLSQLATLGNQKAFNLPRPMIHSGDFDFSFSGLKTAVANLVSSSDFNSGDREQLRANIAAATESAIVEVLIHKTITAAQKYEVGQILIAGGVAANQVLREEFHKIVSKNLPQVKLFIPEAALCTDNAVTTTTAAFFNPTTIDSLEIQANPELSLLPV